MKDNSHHDNAEEAPDVILVVEEDESLRILIQRKLNRAGFFSEGISNGIDALMKIANRSYRLLLLDYTLPDMSGIQFVKALAELEYDIPFIVSTGQEKETIVKEMMNMGALEYVLKDNTFLDSIIHSVQKVLE